MVFSEETKEFLIKQGISEKELKNIEDYFNQLSEEQLDRIIEAWNKTEKWEIY